MVTRKISGEAFVNAVDFRGVALCPRTEAMSIRIQKTGANRLMDASLSQSFHRCRSGQARLLRDNYNSPMSLSFRRIFFFLIVLSAAQAAAQTPEKSAPNVVLITID